jgi:hypothetical protein
VGGTAQAARQPAPARADSDRCDRWDRDGPRLLFERNVKQTDVHTLFDAFFFTTVQLLTVSSQIKNPLSVAGRVTDVFLEIWAVLVIAGSAGAIASFFQTGDSK